EFETASGVALEPLYTGKLLLALREAVESGAVARGSRLVALHSGGLQGRRGSACGVARGRPRMPDLSNASKRACNARLP
ncbi:hypothetical protein ACV33H_32980, partial [Pseudomonas aeruginosa]